MSLYIEAYKNLANEIIILAARDYKAALKKEHRLSRTKDENERCTAAIRAQQIIKEVTRFFESSWFELLSDANGPLLLANIRKMTMQEILEKEEFKERGAFGDDDDKSEDGDNFDEFWYAEDTEEEESTK